FEDRLQIRQLELNLALPPFALDEIVNHSALDGAGTIQRIQSREVLDGSGPISPQDIAHALRFKLEDAGGQSAMEDLLVRDLIVQRDQAQVQRLARALLDQLQCINNNSQR